MNYPDYLSRKSQIGTFDGFDPIWMPDFLFPFQRAVTEWGIRKGKAALFEDCGLGKTPQQLVWAENVVRRTNKPVLILTPLSVGAQTVREGAKFGIECAQSRRHGGDDIRLDRVLPYKDSRESDDEKHVHPLQLDVIERACVLWTNPGEIVFTPFMGVGSEVYGAVLNGRKGMGAELKSAYYKQAVRNMKEVEEHVERELIPA